MKNRGIAIMLAIFLGAFGIHQFYLNNITSAMLRLIFCWTGIPLLLGWLDALMMWFGGEQRFQRKYNQPK